MVYDSGKHLLGLINDILDLSKIEAGKIEIIPALFDVKELVETVEKMVTPPGGRKGVIVAGLPFRGGAPDPFSRQKPHHTGSHQSSFKRH